MRTDRIDGDSDERQYICHICLIYVIPDFLLYRMSSSELYTFSYSRILNVIVHFVDIGEIVTHRSLNFLLWHQVGSFC